MLLRRVDRLFEAVREEEVPILEVLEIVAVLQPDKRPLPSQALSKRIKMLQRHIVRERTRSRLQIATIIVLKIMAEPWHQRGAGA